MPHIRVRGLALEDLEFISDKLIGDLASLFELPTDHFTLEYQPTTYLVAGGASSAYPFIEILAFEREQEIKDKAANIITSMIQPLMYSEKDICVIFHNIEGNNYFENGDHF